MISKRMRGAMRFAILLGSLVEALVRFLPIYVRCRGQISTLSRIEWLHASCRRIARRLSLQPRVNSVEPVGLTVSNHLSYLDILVFGAARPFLFVAKSEVKAWPLLGTLAQLGGTIFVARENRLQAAEASRQIEQSLRHGLPVLLFPEGTSSDGQAVLPFKPSLLESAVRAGAPVTAAAVSYCTADGGEQALCWWGEMDFLPHLLRTLAARALQVTLAFDVPCTFSDRKTAARITHDRVEDLRSQLCPFGASPFTRSPGAVVSIPLCPPPRKTAST